MCRAGSGGKVVLMPCASPMDAKPRVNLKRPGFSGGLVLPGPGGPGAGCDGSRWLSYSVGGMWPIWPWRRISLNHQTQFEGGELEVVDPAPGAFVADALGLVEPDHRLGHGVIEAVAHGADRREGAGIGEAARCNGSRCTGSRRRVVDKPVDELVGLLAGPQGHLQRVEGQLGGHGGLGPPSDDATREHVGHERGEHRARPGRHVGEIDHPQLVGLRGGEVPVHQIRRSAAAGSGRVVVKPLSRRTPRSPSARINRSTWQRGTGPARDARPGPAHGPVPCRPCGPHRDPDRSSSRHGPDTCGPARSRRGPHEPTAVGTSLRNRWKGRSCNRARRAPCRSARPRTGPDGRR